jgi:hypothetical protein
VGADRERAFLVEPDTHGVIRVSPKQQTNQVIQARAAKIWSTASHVHFNYDFRFNSQSTAACYTQQKTIGGRAWPSICFHKSVYEKAFVLWANSTLGLLTYWLQANKTQSGRGTITLTAIPDLPVADLRRLSPQQLAAADSIFDVFLKEPLRPVNELVADTTRHALDEAVMVQVFGIPKVLLAADGLLHLFRRKLAAEPSITGSKAPKP